MSTSRIRERVDPDDFLDLVHHRKIVIGTHARDHLSIAQREVYREDQLILTISNETPVLVGLQENGRYAAYYQRAGHYLKLILADKTTRLELVTFINTRVLPSIERNP
jgi:hypothetical protein